MELLLGLVPFGAGDVMAVLKTFYLLGVLMYLIFAVVVYRQAAMMEASLEGQLILPTRFLAAVHVTAAVIVLVLAVVML